MKKSFTLAIKISLSLVLSSTIVACSSTSEQSDDMSNLWELAHKGYDYGYDLPKAKSASTADMSTNVKQCTSLKTVMEQYYCILGIAFKATNKAKVDQKLLERMPVDGIAEFANDQLHYIGHPGYGIYKK